MWCRQESDKRLSILFFMSFSLKPLSPPWGDREGPRGSQSSFSWAFLWNDEKGGYQWGRDFVLSILFFMSFSLKPVHGGWVQWATQIFLSQSSFSWAFLWNRGGRNHRPTHGVTNLSILFFMSFSLKRIFSHPLAPTCVFPLSILFFMSFSLKRLCREKETM